MPTIVKREGHNGPRYQVKCRFKGEPPFSKTFRTLREAKQWSADMESSRDKRRAYTDPGAYKTVAAAIDERISSGIDAADVGRLIWWKDQIGDVVLRELDDTLILRKLDGLTRRRNTSRVQNGQRVNRCIDTGEPVAPATRNRYLTALSATLEHVREKGWLARSWRNPARDVPRRREDNERTRWLSRPEREALLAVCAASSTPGLYGFVVAALWSGARYSELTTLTWDRVDLEAGRAYLPETKNGDPRTIILLPEVVEALRLWQNRGGVIHAVGLVWPGKDPHTPKNFRYGFEKAVSDAGIENFTFHCLRHTAGSYLAKAGANQAQIMKTLGHRTLSASARYQHLDTADSEAALKRAWSHQTGGNDDEAQKR